MVRLLYIALTVLTFSVPVSAANFLVVEGRLTDATGTVPIEEGDVDFTLDVYDSSGSCLIYSESHSNNDLSGSLGYFSLELGGGSATHGSPLSARFDNSVTHSCDGGGSSTVVANSPRILKISFDANDGNGLQVLQQDITIGATAYALEASKVGGLASSDIIQVNTAGAQLDQASLESIFDSAASVTELRDLIDGTSANYLSSAPTADFNVNSQKITNVAAPTAASDAANKNYVDSYVAGLAADTPTLSGLGAGDTGEVMVWNGTQWTAAAPAEDTTKLSLAGGTMTGQLLVDGGSDQVQLAIEGVAGQSANLVEFRDSASTVVASISPDGSVSAATNLATKSYVDTQVSASGDITGGSSIGTGGVHVYRSESTGVLQFASINDDGNSKVTVTNDVVNNEIDLSVDESYFNSAAIPNAPSGNITATNVQAAINELDGDKVAKEGDSMSGALTMGTTNEVRFGDADNDRFVGFKAPTTITATASFVWELPVDDGSNGQVLQTDGAGALSFVSIPSAPVQTARNVNIAGTGVFKQLNGTDLEFRGINAAADGKVTVTLDGANNEIDLSVDESNFNSAAIPNAPSGNITATNVQAAIDQLDTGKQAALGFTPVNQAGDTMTGALAVVTGSAAAPGLTFSGDTDTGVFHPLTNNIAFTTGGSESVRIKGGDVGIGITAPSARLSIRGGSLNPLLDIKNNSTNPLLSVNNQHNIGIGHAGDAGTQDMVSVGNPLDRDDVLKVFSYSDAPIMGLSDAGNLSLTSHAADNILYLKSYGASSRILASSSDGSTGTPAAVPTARDLLTIEGQGYDGTSSATGAMIRMSSTEAWSGAAHGTDMGFFVTPSGTNTPQEAMVIADSGNVGIGTIAPEAKLHVRGQLRVDQGTVVNVGSTCSSMERGNLVNDSSTSKLLHCDGNEWRPVGSHAPNPNGGGLSFDFAASSKHSSGGFCDTFTFSGMQDGGHYQLLIDTFDGSSHSCSFSQSAPTLSFRYPASTHSAQPSSTRRLYKFDVYGNEVFVSWVDY